MRTVSVIVVGYRSRAVLGPCLAAVARAGSRFLTLEVFVVDNASGDGTPAWVRQEHPAFQLLENSSNVGFARACNQALRLSHGEHILFLNPDTELPPGAIEGLLAALDADPRAALASPRLLGGGPPAWGRFPTLLRLILGRLGRPDPREPAAGPVDWVLGACMLGRADRLRDLGGFDEDYFLYGEDLDLCDRVSKAGWHVLYCPSIVVPHRGNDVWNTERLARVRGALLTFYSKRRNKACSMLLGLGIRAAQAFERKRPPSSEAVTPGGHSPGDQIDTPERKAP